MILRKQLKKKNDELNRLEIDIVELDKDDVTKTILIFK